MSAATVEFLVSRLNTADRRWDLAMAREGYRDDPEEGDPFTEQDWALYGWADAWRCAVHEVESELFSLPEVRAGYLTALASEGEETVFVSEASVAELVASTYGDAPEPNPRQPPQPAPQKPRAARRGKTRGPSQPN